MHFRISLTIYLLGFKFRSLKIKINMERFNLWSGLLNIMSSYTPLASIFFLNNSFIFRYFLSSFSSLFCLKFLFSFPFNIMLLSLLLSILFLFRLYRSSFYINQISCLLKKEVTFIFFHCSLTPFILCSVFLLSLSFFLPQFIVYNIPFIFSPFLVLLAWL